jgi:hypothetical protein
MLKAARLQIHANFDDNFETVIKGNYCEEIKRKQFILKRQH